MILLLLLYTYRYNMTITSDYYTRCRVVGIITIRYRCSQPVYSIGTVVG